MRGTVFKSTGSWYHVRLQDGEFVEARIKGKFRLQGIKSTNPIAVGDKVDLMNDGEDYTISSIYDRKNYIIRKSNNLSKQTHIIACNIDQAILFVTTVSPITSLGFIDRFLVAAESFYIPSVLLFNKDDLLDDASKQHQKENIALYESVGYRCYEVSALTGFNLGMIKDILKDKTTLIAGHSGTGKSTLINKLNPAFNLRTGLVSEYSNKGIHTTTFAEMHEIFKDALIIDTPGIKDFGVIHLEKNEIKDYMKDFVPFASLCKFNDCLHINEPQCAIKQAVDDGMIAALRYNSYLSMYFSE
jgi:ribosome biogenesis GTPase